MQNLLSSNLLSRNINITICRTTVVPVALYGYDIWSPTLREERRLRVFENRVLRRIFGPKRDEVTREWRKLGNEELNNLHSSPNTIWVIKSRMSCTGHVAHMGERRGVYRVLLREGDRLEDPSVDVGIKLRWIFRKWDGGYGLV